MLNAKKTRKSVEAALAAIDGYMAERAATLFEPLLEHLREVGEARSCTEIEAHFKRNFDVGGVTTACEYLADQGLIGKVSTAVQLTKMSNVAVQELAFIHMGEEPDEFAKAARVAARTTIAVHGARVHNLKNVNVEIPRDKLIVVTGLSGSGKSSLAFDTIYAEGQRRYMESLSTYAKRFVSQVAKPDVDFVYGLSPVISIEQKTIANNPRSTVGTMTDIASYLNLLFATIGVPHCPRTGELTPSRTASQILEAILALPEGTEIELRAPVFKQYGEELDFVLTEVRKKGCRILIDRRQARWTSRRRWNSTKPRSRKWTRWWTASRWAASTRRRSRRGSRPRCWWATDCCRSQIVKGAGKAEAERFYRGLCSKTHHFVYGDIQPEYFMFNNPESACRTCGGLGVHKLTHPELLVPDPKRSIAGGCFVREAFKYNPDTWDGRVMYSLSKALNFSLDTPWDDAARDGTARDSRGAGAPEDRAPGAAGGEGEAGRGGREADRLRRDRAAHRTALPALPAARRGEFGDGGVAG